MSPALLALYAARAGMIAWITFALIPAEIAFAAIERELARRGAL